MKIYKKVNYASTTIEQNESVDGETLEIKMERIINNGEPIQDGAPIIYTERIS